MNSIAIGWALAGCGVAVAMAMGAVARLEHFCTLSALERRWYAGDSQRRACLEDVAAGPRQRGPGRHFGSTRFDVAGQYMQFIE